MSTKKRVVSAALAAAVGVSLLCGFGFAQKDYVYQQFETAEPVTSVTVTDASAKVTIQAADTDHITVRYAALPDEEPLYDISVQDGRLVVEARDDVDVDTTDDGGPALVRVRIEGHSIDPTPDRELTVTLPDKQYEQLEAGLAVGTLKVEGVDAKTLSVAAAAGGSPTPGRQDGMKSTESSSVRAWSRYSARAFPLCVGGTPSYHAAIAAAVIPVPQASVSASTPFSKVRIFRAPSVMRETKLTLAPSGANSASCRSLEPSEATFTLSASSVKSTKCRVPVFRNQPPSTRRSPNASIILSLTVQRRFCREIISPVCSPSGASNTKLFPSDGFRPRKSAKATMHRPPLPHIMPPEPSEL